METFDYIVVGVRAPAAARSPRSLAEDGFKRARAGSGRRIRGAVYPDGLPQDYEVPVFHALLHREHGHAWDYLVHDFSERRESPARDPDRAIRRSACFIPAPRRLGRLHGAQRDDLHRIRPIEDWNTSRASPATRAGSAAKMRSISRRLEKCRAPAVLAFIERCWQIGSIPRGHGFKGWLSVNCRSRRRRLEDLPLVESLVLGPCTTELAISVGARPSPSWQRIGWALDRIVLGEGDPNDLRALTDNAFGLAHTRPLANRSMCARHGERCWYGRRSIRKSRYRSNLRAGARASSSMPIAGRSASNTSRARGSTRRIRRPARRRASG